MNYYLLIREVVFVENISMPLPRFFPMLLKIVVRYDYKEQ